MRIHKVGIDEFKVDSYWMKLKTPTFEDKLSFNQTRKKLVIIKKIDILTETLVCSLLMKEFY